MNGTEREAPKRGLSKERFLEDVRPLLDEALRQRVGVHSVEFWSNEGEPQSSEKLRIHFKEENAPRMSLVEITPNSLYVNKYDPEMGEGEWDVSSVFFGSINEGEAPRFYINETKTPVREITEADWVRVLKKAKDALAVAVSGHSKAEEAEPDSTKDNRDFLHHYDKRVQETVTGN